MSVTRSLFKTPDALSLGGRGGREGLGMRLPTYVGGAGRARDRDSDIAKEESSSSRSPQSANTFHRYPSPSFFEIHA